MSSWEPDYVMPSEENPEEPWETNPQSYDEAYRDEYKIQQYDSDKDSDPSFNDSKSSSEGNSSDPKGNLSKSSSATPPSPKDSSEAGLAIGSSQFKPRSALKMKRKLNIDQDEELVIKRKCGAEHGGYSLLMDPHHNKGLAFSDKERDAYYLRGLLPPSCMTQELQEKKLMHNIRQYEVPLQRYMAMMDLQERNERLFYKLLIDNIEELLPIVYTPTVVEACQKYGSIFTHPRGLYISLKEKGKILEVLRNWPEKTVEVIVVTDGERILGLGDLGCQGMGIPVGKLSLYTALGGLRPSACLPVTIDVGTNNEQLLKDEFYIGLRQKRATGQEYADLVDEFMCAVKQNYGEKVLIQFEAFGNHNTFELLAKYGTTHLVFNDDIKGTASMVLAGLVAALKLVGGTFSLVPARPEQV